MAGAIDPGQRIVVGCNGCAPDGHRYPHKHDPYFDLRGSTFTAIKSPADLTAALAARRVDLAAGSMAKATIHEPVGAKDLWHHKGWQLPAYIQHIANDLREKRGMTESRAIATAVAVVKRWAAGVGNVHPDTRAAAMKALAEWEALKAKAAATRTKNLTATPTATVDLTGPHGYRHGWIRVNASEATAIERATRAVITDGHAMLHGPGMVSAAQRIAERVRSGGHRVHVKRIHLDGKTHLHVRRTTR